MSDLLTDERLTWYVMRGSGLVLLCLLTLAILLGVLATISRPRRRIPRFALQTLHRDVALISLVLLVVHVTTAVLHSYVDISWPDAVIPFASAYQPLWTGLGTVAVDLALVATAAAYLRGRLGPPVWRIVHGAAYLGWVAAVAHTLGSGSDTGRLWGAAAVAAAVLTFLVALTVRLARAGRTPFTPVVRGRSA